MREPIGIWSAATTTSTVGRFPELRISAICCCRLCTYRTPMAAASAPTRIATRKTLPGFILPPPFHLRAYRPPAVAKRYRAPEAEPTEQQGPDGAHHLDVPAPDPAHRKRPEEHANRDPQPAQAVEQAGRPHVGRVERDPDEHGRARDRVWNSPSPQVGDDADRDEDHHRGRNEG